MRLGSLLLAMAAATALASAPAMATPSLSIQLSDGTNTVTLPGTCPPSAILCSATPNAITFDGAVGVFNLNVTTGQNLQGMGVSALPGIDLNSVNDSSGAGTLTIQLTETGLTNPAPVTEILSQIGGTLNGSVVQYTTWYDPNNNPFGENILLANQTFTGSPFASSDLNSVVTSDPFSMTEQVVITAPGHSATSFDAQMTVPEPASLALLGVGLLGLGVVRRRA